MRRDEVRDAIDALASAVPAPDADATAAITRGRHRIRNRRLTLASVVAALAVIVASVGVIANRDTPTGTPRIDSRSLGRPTTTMTTITTIPPPVVPAGPRPIQLAFVSPAEGWLCADPMQHTTDAGATWTNVPVTAQPLACAAVPGGDAWALLPSSDPRHQQLVHVAAGNGPQTFAFPQLPNSLVVDELHFVDARNGFAFAHELARGPERALLETRDGGQTWDVVSTAVFGALRFASATSGWAAQVPNETAALLRTADRGRTWSSVPVPWPQTPGSVGVDIRPVTVAGDLIVAQGSNPDGHLTHLFFDLSTDGGRTWSMRSAPPVPFASDRVAPVGATDADHWQVGSTDQLWTTADGGGTWTRIAEFAGISQITAVDFITPEIGFVAATGIGTTADGTVVLQTNDGGDSWSTVAISAPPMSGDGPINFPGGIFGCPTHRLAAPPSGDPPAGLIEAAVRNIVTSRGWTPVGEPTAYRVGTDAGNYSEIFNFQIPSCGPGTVAASWVVELQGAPGSGGGGSTPQAQVVLAYSPDGWHVYGRYH
jgi:photosystem II stability/assembly factor-like uncharacterized protein